MARTHRRKKKGNAHTTKYENDTPVGWQGFIICLRNAARYFVALWQPSVAYVYVRALRFSSRSLSGLHFPTARRAAQLKYGVILRRACVFFWSRTSMYAPVRKASRSLSGLHFPTARRAAQSKCGVILRCACLFRKTKAKQPVVDFLSRKRK